MKRHKHNLSVLPEQHFKNDWKFFSHLQRTAGKFATLEAYKGFIQRREEFRRNAIWTRERTMPHFGVESQQLPFYESLAECVRSNKPTQADFSLIVHSTTERIKDMTTEQLLLAKAKAEYDTGFAARVTYMKNLEYEVIKRTLAMRYEKVETGIRVVRGHHETRNWFTDKALISRVEKKIEKRKEIQHTLETLQKLLTDVQASGTSIITPERAAELRGEKK